MLKSEKPWPRMYQRLRIRERCGTLAWTPENNGHPIQPWHSLPPTYRLKVGLDSEGWESWTQGRSPATDAAHSTASLSTCSRVYTYPSSGSDWFQAFHNTTEFCSFALKPNSHSSSNSNTTRSSPTSQSWLSTLISTDALRRLLKPCQPCYILLKLAVSVLGPGADCYLYLLCAKWNVVREYL